jgi:hypothetical protein
MEAGELDVGVRLQEPHRPFEINEGSDDEVSFAVVHPHFDFFADPA